MKRPQRTGLPRVYVGNLTFVATRAHWQGASDTRDTNHPLRTQKYTTQRLAPIVASSFSFSEVIRKLGLTPNSGIHRLISGRIRYAGLDISHFHSQTYRARIDAIPRARVAELAAQSSSIAAMLASLTMPTTGRPAHEMARRLRELEIDCTHFRGRAWSRGATRTTHPSIDRIARKIGYSDEEVFAENSAALRGQSIVRRLVAMGWPYECATCGVVDWLGVRLVLHLDHINGIHNDNRFENIRLLCPNCHSQTPTYCNRAREVAACYTYATRAWRNW
jgi:5-methylcytosine-specific restriction endonuclease McrA